MINVLDKNDNLFVGIKDCLLDNLANEIYQYMLFEKVSALYSIFYDIAQIGDFYIYRNEVLND